MREIFPVIPSFQKISEDSSSERRRGLNKQSKVCTLIINVRISGKKCSFSRPPTTSKLSHCALMREMFPVIPSFQNISEDSSSERRRGLNKQSSLHTHNKCWTQWQEMCQNKCSFGHHHYSRKLLLFCNPVLINMHWENN